MQYNKRFVNQIIYVKETFTYLHIMVSTYGFEISVSAFVNNAV